MFIDGGGGFSMIPNWQYSRIFCQSSFSISGVDDQFSVIASFSTDAI